MAELMLGTAMALAPQAAVAVAVSTLRSGGCMPVGWARMGTDPLMPVAGPTGELHGVPSVWIGDTGAFPTPSA